MTMIDGVSTMIHNVIDAQADVTNALLKNGLASSEEATHIAKVVVGGLADKRLDELRNRNASEVTHSLKMCGNEPKQLEHSIVAEIPKNNEQSS